MRHKLTAGALAIGIGLIVCSGVCRADAFITSPPPINPAFTIRVDEFNKVTFTPQSIPIMLQRIDSDPFCNKVVAAGIAIFHFDPSATNVAWEPGVPNGFANFPRINIGEPGKGLCTFGVTASMTLPLVSPYDPPMSQSEFEKTMVGRCGYFNRRVSNSMTLQIWDPTDRYVGARPASAALRPWILKNNGSFEWKSFAGSSYPNGVLPLYSKLVCDAVPCVQMKPYSPRTLPAAVVGMPIGNLPLFTGGRKPFRIASPGASSPLPPGLKLDENGILSGVPAQEGNFRFELKVYDSCPYNADPALPNHVSMIVDYYDITVYGKLPPRFGPVSANPSTLPFSGGQVLLQAAVSDPLGVAAATGRLVDASGRAIETNMTLKPGGTVYQGVWEGMISLPPNALNQQIVFRVEVAAKNNIGLPGTGTGPQTVTMGSKPQGQMPALPRLPR